MFFCIKIYLTILNKLHKNIKFNFHFGIWNKMNTLIKLLKAELFDVVKKHAQENDIKVTIPEFSKHELNIQIIISGEQQLDITLNSIKN
ncbi:MAG: hypothetical protein AB8W33_10215 [Arsenophonus endosymbiont of Dermacentor nuttalli]